MPLAVIERAMSLFPETNFTNAYGLTETSSTIAALTPERTPTTLIMSVAQPAGKPTGRSVRMFHQVVQAPQCRPSWAPC